MKPSELKVSEVLELGRLALPDIHGVYLSLGDNPCGCLIGSACYAFGYREQTGAWQRKIIGRFINSTLPQLAKYDTVACPACGYNPSANGAEQVRTPGFMLEHLYEGHMWTREQVIAWVKEQEALEVIVSVPLPVHTSCG